MEFDPASGKHVFRVTGHCPICEAPSEFVATRDEPLDARWWPNYFRDHLICVHCGSIPRERALFAVISRFYPNWRDLAIHESSPGNRGASVKLRRECPRYIETQYDPALGLGNIHPERGYRSEDLEAQTFEDECFDLVITQDVFEHLFDPAQALREIGRTLKPGGAHIFTVPIVNGSKPSVRRAQAHERDRGASGRAAIPRQPDVGRGELGCHRLGLRHGPVSRLAFRAYRLWSSRSMTSRAAFVRSTSMSWWRRSREQWRRSESG